MFWLTGRTNRIYFKNWKRFRFRRPAWLVNPLLLLVIAGTLAGATFGFCQILMWQIESLCERRWELSFELKEGRGEVKTRQVLLAGMEWKRRKPDFFFYEMTFINNSNKDFAGHVDVVLPDYMYISNLKGAEIVSSRDTLDGKWKSHRIEYPVVKAQDSISFKLWLSCTDLRSEEFHLSQIYEVPREKDFYDFAISDIFYHNYTRVFISGAEDTFRVYGNRWAIRTVPDSLYQPYRIEERYIWVYIGSGNEHIRGRSVILEDEPNKPPLPSRVFIESLICHSISMGNCYKEPF